MTSRCNCFIITSLMLPLQAQIRGFLA
jgi:hypothetical protein